MITKRCAVVHYHVPILFISDRQYAQIFFLFLYEYFRCLHSSKHDEYKHLKYSYKNKKNICAY
jgi:hypothetical protein